MKNPKIFKRGLLIACAAGPLAAYGQAAVSAETQSSDATLEEIVVTARKREESIQDTPASITALSAQQIAKNDLGTLEKLAAGAPQLVVSRSAGSVGSVLILRGVGSASLNAGIEQSVALIVDGAYYSQGRIINDGFFDLARVELLKGPQVLFYGKNATAGVISITTADPTDEFEASAKAGYEFEAREVYGEGMVSGPLTETLGVRVAVRASKMFGGYTTNHIGPVIYPSRDVATGVTTNLIAPPADRDAPGERKIAGRVTLKWQPSERFDAVLKATYNESHSNNSHWNAIKYACPNGRSQTNPAEECRRAFVINQMSMPREIAASMPYSGDGSLYDDYRSYALNGQFTYDLGRATLTTLLNYHDIDSTRLLNQNFSSATVAGRGIWGPLLTRWHAFSGESRILTNYDGPLNVLVGAYYQNTSFFFRAINTFSGLENSAAAKPENRYVGFRKDSTTDGETIAAFGQVIWKIAPALEFDAGVRYTRETKDAFFIQDYVNPALRAVFLENVPINSDQTFTNWSPEATLTWKPTEDVTVYGAYKTGYKSGGFENASILSANTDRAKLSFGPETVKGFEGGVKTTLLDRTLRFNAGVYSYKYSNLQIDYFDSAATAFFASNAGTVRSKGVELEAEWAPRAIPGLRLRSNVNYNKAYYISFFGPCWGGQTVAQGCSIVGVGNSRSQDLSGAPLVDAPVWTGNVGVEYEGEIGGGLFWGFSGNARFSDDYQAGSLDHPLQRQPSYTVLDASLRFGSASNRWEVALIGKNLTNRAVINGVIEAPGTGAGTGTATGVQADQIGFLTLPRTVQLQFSWRY